MNETEVSTSDVTESTVPEKEFVRRLMTATCSECDKKIMEFQYLNLPKDHGVYFQSTDTPLMNACDYKSGKHVLQFGRCKSQENPKNKAKGLVDKVVSNPLVKAMCPAAFAVDAVLAVNEKLAGGNCKCNPLIMKVWEETNQGNCLDGADGILNTSKLACCYGGTITITYVSEGGDATGDTTQNAVIKKTVAERMPQSVASQIEAMNAEGMDAEGMDDTSADGNSEAAQGNESGSSASGGSASEGSSSDTSWEDTDAFASDAMFMDDEDYGYGTQAIMEDMLNWYDQEMDFEQNYAISQNTMYSNYANNRCQIMPMAALNDEGYIHDMSELSGFRLAGSSAALIGAGCVSAFNAMHALGVSRPFADVIMAAEMQQTVPGFINQGPMAAGIVSTAAMCTKMGLKARTVSPKKLLKAERSGKASLKNSVAVVGSTRPDGRAEFHTLKADATGKLCCMENKKLSPQKLISAKGKKQVIMQISAKK